jgi:hypothetical protein
MTPTLTVFANFRIDNNERFNRMIDSFESFKNINAEKWIINIRGRYKLKVLFFLEKHLGNKLHPFLMESHKGWFYDTKDMLKEITTDYVFFWIEDHINMIKDISVYEKLLNDMFITDADILIYSFLNDAYLKRYKTVSPEYETNNIKVYNIDKKMVDIITESYGMFYIVTAVSFLKTSFFKKIICTNHPLLKRWPKKTPFDFEKKSTDTCFLPVRYAVPKYELFASIDDDFGTNGYSLVSRGFDRWDNRYTMKLKDGDNKKPIAFKFYKKIPDFMKFPFRKCKEVLLRIKYTLF